jgi:hypothetical protein
MNKSMLQQIDPLVLCLFLFALMLIMVWVGNRLRHKFWSPEEGDTRGGVNSLLGALFGLWAFLLAFTFGQSGARFESVRSMIVDEANILRTAIIRADLFPDSARDAYRAQLKKYLEERIAYYEYAGNEEKFKANRQELSYTAASLWAITVQESKRPNMAFIAGPMAATLTSLFDIGIKREALLSFGVPHPVVLILISLAMAISVVGGFTTPAIKRKEWMLIALFILLAVSIIYVTIDLARPMDGLIKPDTGEATMISLRKFF